jgi:hypothetical protein
MSEWSRTLNPLLDGRIRCYTAAASDLGPSNDYLHDHTNEDQTKKRPTGPLCKLNPCIHKTTGDSIQEHTTHEILS